jgi:hypothetical protein
VLACAVFVKDETARVSGMHVASCIRSVCASRIRGMRVVSQRLQALQLSEERQAGLQARGHQLYYGSLSTLSEGSIKPLYERSVKALLTLSINAL